MKESYRKRLLVLGGLAAALALRKAGFTPVVHRAHPDSGHDIGALAVAGNGMFALVQVKADQAVDGDTVTGDLLVLRSAP
jgi:2-polyprenyl-6-methoxyphenol hydroxylase-like FAD-dependent oxidoreductase